jgi:hypothetical protein
VAKKTFFYCVNMFPSDRCMSRYRHNNNNNNNNVSQQIDADKCD